MIVREQAQNRKRVEGRENFHGRGNVVIEEHWSSESPWAGQLKRRLQKWNKIPAEGRQMFRDVMRGTAAAPSHVAVGIATSSASDDMTVLGDETHRNVLTQRTAITDGVAWKFFLPSGVANGAVLTEAAVFNSSATSSGLMLSRVLHDPITKSASITVTYTWTHTWTTT